MPDYGRATATEYALWASGAFVTHLDAWIERVSGGETVFQSYRSFGGWDWIRSLNLADSGVDVPIGSGTLVLHRQRGLDNLSPLVTASPLNQDGGEYAPAIEFGREIVIRTADTPTLGFITTTADRTVNAVSLPVLALERGVGKGSILHLPQGQVRVTTNAAAGATSVAITPLATLVPAGTKSKISHEPMAADWKVRFVGVTDDPEWGGKDSDKVSVPFRDRNGVLSDTYVRAAKVYGTEAGVAVMTVSQAIVDDWMGAGQYILSASPAAPDFNVTRYEVTELSIWEALEKLGDQTGAVWRQKWSTFADDYLTTLVTPPRDKTTPDYEVPPSTYLDVSHISTGSANLRTIVRVYGVETGTQAELVYQIPAEALVATDPKVLQYGPRYLQLAEDNTSAIDTQAELEAFANAIYADVSAPPIPLEVETKYCWFAEPDQLVRWKANGKLWDEDQDSAVLSLTHDFPSPGVARTRWKTAGKPKGRYASWMNQGVAIAGRGADASLTLSNFLPSPVTAAGTPFTWTPSSGVVRSIAAAGEFEGAEEAPWMWEQLDATMVPTAGNTVLMPNPRQGYVSLVQARGLSKEGRLGPLRRARRTGSVAVVHFKVEFLESADGLSSAGSVEATDVRGVVSAGEYWLTYPGAAETGPFSLLTGPSPSTWVIPSFPLASKPHSVLVRLEMQRNDGQPPIPVGPFAADPDKVPAQPTARVHSWNGVVATVYVDNPDTDATVLWYKEVDGGGVAGVAVEIPARGSDPRFGSAALSAASDRRFQFVATNAAGVEGPYLDFRLLSRTETPAVEVRVHERMVGGEYVGTVWWRVQELGLGITSTEVTTQIGREPESAPVPPMRVQGANSVVLSAETGTPTLLGPGEREHDVLVLKEWSHIRPVEVMGSRRMSVLVPPFDRNKLPSIVSIDIVELDATCMGEDVVSWAASAPTLSPPWTQSRDGAVVKFLNIPVPETDAAVVTFTARNVALVNIGAPGMVEVSETRIVRGALEAVDSDRPRWGSDPAVTSPSAGSDDIGFTLQAIDQPDTAPPLSSFTVRIWERHNTGGAWSPYVDVTADVTPFPASPTSTASAYSFGTGKARSATGTLPYTVEIKAEILEGTTVRDARAGVTIYYLADRVWDEPV
jgi:hypothetical protein